MAITGISSIDNKQIIAAGALSATSANQALVTSGGDSLQGLYDTVSTNSASWTGGGGGELPQSATEAIETVTANSATWDSVTAKQDALNFGYHDTAISSIDNSTLYDNSAHARIKTLAGRISDLSSNKLDTTAFSDVSGSFLTAHQDISNKLDTTAFSDVSGNFLTAVPDTYLQNTDLSTTDGKVTAISGIPLSAGGDVPEGVMVESGLEYNAVNEISAYNGSAIAQYGAEKQWLQHDDTLVHAANSAQYALGVNLSAVAQLLGVDETVLQDNIANSATTFTLSEPAGNFDRLRLYDSYGTIVEVSGNNSKITWTFDRTHSNGTRMNRCYTITSNNGIDWNEVNVYGWNQTAYTGALALNGGTNWYLETTKIVGIGRKQ